MAATNVCFVTGGAGFIGSVFVRNWIKQERGQVVVLDKLTYAGSRELLAEVEHSGQLVFQQGDIADGPLVDQLLQEHRPQTIFNFAAESHVDRSIDQSAPFVQSNVVGAWQLLDSATRYWQTLAATEQEAFRFVQLSTDEVYGSSNDEKPFDEQSLCLPSSPYSASKAAADQFCRAFHHTFGLPVIVTRSSNNYGPFQHAEKLIPSVIQKAIAGKSIPIYGSGQQMRDWLHVDDHCRALQLVLEQGTPGEIYNISGENEWKNLELAQLLCELVDAECPNLPHSPCRDLIEFVEDRPGHDQRYLLDASRIRNELNWKPTVPFLDGLRETVRWVIEHSNKSD